MPTTPPYARPPRPGKKKWRSTPTGKLLFLIDCTTNDHTTPFSWRNLDGRFEPHSRSHEQAGFRPALVVSVDIFNHGPAGLAVVLPVTSRAKGITLHVGVDPPEAGLAMKSFIKTEDVRSVAVERLTRRLGLVSDATMDEVEDRLRILLNLYDTRTYDTRRPDPPWRRAP